MTGRRRVRTVVGFVVPVALVMSACSSSGSATPRSAAPSAPSVATASAELGALRITGGYIPEPASPDVAAAYFTVTNTGSTPDTLDEVTTNVTRHVMTMTETDNGGSGSMTNLPKVVVPAHGTFRFVPGHAHLMLEQPRRPLTTGDRVKMTVTFSHAGTTTLTLPVVPLTAGAGS